MLKRKPKLIFLLPILLISCTRKLPSPELSSGIRGANFGIDKNINEDSIDKYLYRDDVAYRDMRKSVFSKEQKKEITNFFKEREWMKKKVLRMN